MNIVISRTRENENDQTVYWTLTDDDGNSYPWWSDIPKGVDVQKHLESRMDEYLRLIRGREYPDAPPDVRRDAAAMERWIKAGCVVPAEVSVDPFTGREITIKLPTAVERAQWTIEHPPEWEIRKALEEAKDLEALKAVIRAILDK